MMPAAACTSGSITMAASRSMVLGPGARSSAASEAPAAHSRNLPLGKREESAPAREHLEQAAAGTDRENRRRRRHSPRLRIAVLGVA